MASIGSRKLRLLCLHGHRQSGQLFRAKLGGFRKMVKKVADLDFVTSPHKIPGGEEDDFTWWDWQSEDYEQRIHESISAVHKAWTNGSYDGLLCFSQGAALGGLLCLLQHHGKLQFKFDFCILVSGFVPDTHREKYTSLGDERIQVPSLHITGDKDSIIESSRSKDLAKFFLDGEVCQHPGGHYLPYTGDTKDAVLRFLESQAQTLSAKEDTEVVKEV